MTPRLLLVIFQAPGFGGAQDALRPAGIQAERVYAFTWFLVAVAALVVLAVTAALLYAGFHRGNRESRDPELESARQRTMRRGVLAAVAATAVVLIVFLGYDLALGRVMARPAGNQNPLVIEVTGHQWWWQVRYQDPLPSRRLTTANEIHVPVGRPVVLRMSSADVIHSLWIPALYGKKDLIPGRQSETWFRADAEGVYRGQCAEFCGHQHAKMGLIVVVEPPERFAAWYERQLLPAAPPRDPLQARGQEVFLSRSCVLCHAVRGTPAGSRVGPDLTHLASRRTIAAAALPNTRGHLGGWISDPQTIKPGTRMPPTALPAEELRALLAYLESLR